MYLLRLWIEGSVSTPLPAEHQLPQGSVYFFQLS